MKNAIIICLIFLELILVNCNNNNSVNSSYSEIGYLTNFYEEYIQTWDNFDKENYKVFNQKVDSIAKANCTEKLYKDFNRFFELGHDLLTDDLGLEKGSLLIKADSIEHNVFSIFSLTTIEKIPGRPEKIDNYFKVRLTKHNDIFKIEEIISKSDKK